VVNFEPKIRL